MTKERKDVIVIGSGMAGITAAKAASDEQVSVEIITKGSGATAMGSGAIDILGALPRDGKNEMVTDIYEGIGTLIKENKNHPYAKLKASLSDGIKAYRELCRLGGMEFFGDGIRNLVVPNILGTFKSTAYVPVSKDADVTEAEGRILVCGFKGHTEFYAEYSCKSFNIYQEVFAPKASAQYIATTIELPSMEGRTKVTNAELAAFFDTQEGIEELLSVLKKLKTVMGGVQRFLLPPVLGYEKYTGNLAKLKEELGVPVGELACAGHSISAQRLTSAFQKGARKAGIKMTEQAKVIRIDKGEDGTYKVQYEQYGEKREACAKAVVLAIGGFIGGGITSYREDLLVPVLDMQLGRIDVSMVNQKAFPSDGQAFIKVGVKVYDNLALAESKMSGQVFACGDFMEGYDWVYERSGGGVAAASGYLAGKNAASMAKGSEN